MDCWLVDTLLHDSVGVHGWSRRHADPCPSLPAAAAVAKDLDSHTKLDQAPPAEPALKKQKTAGSSNAAGGSSSKVIRQSLFSEQSRSKLHEELHTAQPYTHVVIQELCDPAVLRAVREEVIHNISATYKETDLFKVFQTGERWGGGGETHTLLIEQGQHTEGATEQHCCQ